MEGLFMGMSDIEIAQGARMQRIIPLAAARLGIADQHLEPYGLTAVIKINLPSGRHLRLSMYSSESLAL